MRNAKVVRVTDRICSDPTYFVNREKEKLTFLKWLQRLISVRNNSLYIIGDSGIGKSSFLSQIANRNNKHVYGATPPNIYSFVIQCIPGCTMLSILDSAVFPKRPKPTGGSLSLFGFGGGVSFARNLQSDFDVWLKKVNKKFGDKPIVFFIDNINNMIDVDNIVNYVKVIFEKIQNEYDGLNINFVFSGDDTLLNYLDQGSANIIPLKEITYEYYSCYLDIISIYKNINIDLELQPLLFKEAEGNFRKIVKCIERMEFKYGANLYTLDHYKNICEVSYEQVG